MTTETCEVDGSVGDDFGGWIHEGEPSSMTEAELAVLDAYTEERYMEWLVAQGFDPFGNETEAEFLARTQCTVES